MGFTCFVRGRERGGTVEDGTGRKVERAMGGHRSPGPGHPRRTR